MSSSCARLLLRARPLGVGRALGDWTSAMAPTSATAAARVGGARQLTAATGAAAASTASATGASTRAGPARVVVLGGGFGGLYAAVRLDQLMWPRGTKPQVTLVDQSERFVFKPLLYELVNGTATEEEVAPPLAQLLAPYPVRFVQAQVSGVHPSEPAAAAGQHPAAAAAAAADPAAAGHVALADGTTLPYDYLLVALGAAPDTRGVPGVREWAVPFVSLDDALRVKGTLDLLADSGAGGSVVIVGGGYAGVELAAVVAERLRSGGGGGTAVRLVTPGADVLEGAPAGQREAANRVLASLGVEVVTGARVRELAAPSASPSSSADADADAATSIPTACTVVYSRPLASAAPTPSPSSSSSSASTSPAAPAAGGGAGAGGNEEVLQLRADLVVWTAGSAPATREGGQRRGFPFPTSGRGAVETEPSLRVVGSRSVFALGDVAVTETEHLPATAQVAFQQADYAAWNIWAAINGRPLLPFRYQHLGSMMSLGQLNAAVALPLELPQPLTEAVRASPLGPLLSAAGVRLGGGAGRSAGAGDGGSGVTVEGPLAALLRRGAYLYRQPTNEQRLNVATSWLRQGLEAAAALASGRAR